MPNTIDPAIEKAADLLSRAQAEARACDPIRDVVGEGIDTAYSVQHLLTKRATEAGRTMVGRKIGLTNPAVQRQLGVDQPDTGVLFADMQVADGGVHPLATLIAPRIETEVAIVLGSDLTASSLSTDDIRSAVAHVAVAFEIVDSRIRDWDITIADTVADNASSAGFVVSSTGHPLGATDLSKVRMRMYEGTELVSSGTGADCLGDPITALRWLADAAQDMGRPLRAGEVVLTGALGPMVSAKPGATYRAEVTGLGSVSVSFEPEAIS